MSVDASTVETKQEDAERTDPFAQFVGAIITFSCVNAQNNTFLDGAANSTVYLSPTTFGSFVGTQWRVQRSSDKPESDKPKPTTYQIVNNALNTLLDGEGSAVFLSDGKDPKGTRWRGNYTPVANCYTVENLDSGENKYLAFQDGKVVLSKTANGSNGTYWKIGYVYLTQDQVVSAVRKAYNQVPLNRASTSQLRSMDLPITTKIWTDCNIENHPYNPEKFAGDAFVDLLQSSVNEFIFKDPSKCAAAFGGLFASNSKGTRNVFNFYLTPYLEFVLFDPVTGRPVSTAGWTASIIYI